MWRFIVAAVALVLCQAPAQAAPRKPTLTAFASEDELKTVLKTLAPPPVEHRKLHVPKPAGAMMKSDLQAAAAPAAPAQLGSAAKEAESVTNTQTAGVDEGGIVKVHGKHLVMLRRGRLFTVDIARNRLQPISAVDAFGPDADPAGTWYDEMLISGNTVVVIGYSYARGGTEVGLFDIDEDGTLAYRATYHMRSNDYYSSNNYASRLIGSKLIFYTPLALNLYRDDVFASFPALRKWRPNASPADFKRIAPATRIYRTDDPIEPGYGVTLHTVTTCDLARREMSCEASAILGPRGRVFYVSGEAVYVWTSARAGGRSDQSGLFRMPLDGAAPTALKVSGAPLDQFSFLESADQHLNVLVSNRAGGEGMWGRERRAGELALLRVPLDLFTDGKDSAPSSSYQPLPGGLSYGMQNRYVGQHLLYGSGKTLYAARIRSAEDVEDINLPHKVERIEALGQHAVVIGSGGPDLHFTSLRLGRTAAVAGRFVREGAAQSESRSHGFFYKPGDAQEGMVGLPIVNADAGRHGRFGKAAASVLFLRNTSLELSKLGALAAGPVSNQNDGCRASCVDWYGNSRPLFTGGRVFALMGYELVEGRVQGDRLVETRRASYAPQYR